MNKTKDFYLEFIAGPQVMLHDFVPSLHCIPTVNTGTPCGQSIRKIRQSRVTFQPAIIDIHFNIHYYLSFSLPPAPP
jgi:hypothetical protein